MQVKLGHNGLDRVPSRAKLVPKVTPWHRMSQPQTHTQTQPDGHLTQKPNVVEPLIVADEPSIVTVAPIIAQAFNKFPVTSSAPPVSTCYWCQGRRWWRSIYGPHLICGFCHRPWFTEIVAEWIEPSEVD